MPNQVKDTAGCYADFEKVFREMFYLCLSEYYTCLPCQVVAVNVAAQKVDVQPVLMSYYRGSGTSATRPIIRNVPFWTFRADDTYITLPIKVGDTGLAIFCQRDISNWKETGGTVPLQSERILDYNDAFYIPFMGSSAQAISGYNPDFIEIVKNGKKITVKDGVLEAPEYDIIAKNLNISQNVVVGGTIVSTGAITSSTAVGLADGTQLGTHTHSGVQRGNAQTDPPVK